MFYRKVLDIKPLENKILENNGGNNNGRRELHIDKENKLFDIILMNIQT
jgi:hypothetical protein